jgi:broad specificity phosphatase PhoE
MDELRPLAGRTALVTHGGFSRILIAAMYDVPYDRFWNVHLANVCSAYYTCNGKSFYLGGFNLTPDEVIARSTRPNPYDLRDIWGVSERKDA